MAFVAHADVGAEGEGQDEVQQTGIGYARVHSSWLIFKHIGVEQSHRVLYQGALFFFFYCPCQSSSPIPPAMRTTALLCLLLTAPGFLRLFLAREREIANTPSAQLSSFPLLLSAHVYTSTRFWLIFCTHPARRTADIPTRNSENAERTMRCTALHSTGPPRTAKRPRLTPLAEDSTPTAAPAPLAAAPAPLPAALGPAPAALAPAPAAPTPAPAPAPAVAATNGGGGGAAAGTAGAAGKTTKRSNFLVWDDYFMSVAFLSAMRSKDPSTQVGAW